MARVWLIRHGESEGNAGAPTADPASIRLTALGARQAEQIPRAFTAAPSLIVTSPYLRTQQTAEATRTAFPEVPHEEWDVHEFTYLSPATCRNTTARERRPATAEYWQRSDPAHVHGEGAESFAQLIGRVNAMIASVRSRGLADELVAIFTHGQFIQAVMWMAMAGARECDADFMRGYLSLCRAMPVANAAIVSLRITDREIVVGDVSVAHLEPGG